MSAPIQDDPLATLLALREAREAADHDERLRRLILASAREARRIAAADRFVGRIAALLGQCAAPASDDHPGQPIVLDRPQRPATTATESRPAA